MESRQLANVRTGASMVVAGDRSIVLQGDYTEIRDGTNYNIYAQKVKVFLNNTPNHQIQDGRVKVKKEKDYVGKKKNEKDHARVESQHSLKPSSDRSKVPKSISSSGKREESKDNSFKELTHLKCEVCHQFIPINAAALIKCHPFWSQKYCPSHEYDNTARCCSCERLESRNARYYSLEDGRSLCYECKESAIMDSDECQPLYHAIRDFYEGMNMRIDQQIPMLLVERETLNDAIVGEKNGFHHMPETRGKCLSEEQTVTSILRRPRIGGRQLIGLRTQPQKLTRKCEVTAIIVLYGLPRLLTGAILAHELMRGWLCLNGFRNLNPEVEEGICQVLSRLWLESEVMPSITKKGVRSNVENKLGEFFIHQIAHDSSPTRGGGFRTANAAVNEYGLRRTLEHIRCTGNFPL